MRRIILFFFLVFAVVGCTQLPEEKGVVARVNGDPIYLKDMEARYDLNNIGWVSAGAPTVETMSAEYGSVLSELIVYKLVGIALASEGLAVTDAEVQEEEQAIRADYPEGLFERTLTEEYIDIAVWRQFLQRHLELRLFLNDVLRPKISLNYQEVEAYYKENLSEFYLPERLHVLRVAGADKNEVLRVTGMLEKAEPWSKAVPDASSSVTVREMKLKKDRLPVQWAAALQKLKPKDSSNISSTAYGFEQLILLDILPEKLLGPSQAYSVIERILLERKLNDAFSDWVAKEVSQAKVEVTPLLAKKLGEVAVEPLVVPAATKEEEPYREPASEVGKKSDP
ncbi:MAG: peptidylprolyl isomerase [Desulfovibrionales bacterium]|nr:peptidylprolyl isomerase [Desulfovibrionales bacterium]